MNDAANVPMIDPIAPAPDAPTLTRGSPGATPAPLGRSGFVGPRAERTVSLALQGGGAHGAFTWGVLDALLEDGRLAFEALTGASAGAMNAVVLADGWIKGGPDGARTQLEAFWREVSLDSDLSEPQQALVSVALQFWKHTPFGAFLNAVASPYDTNPLNINPLRRALVQTVDFEALRGADAAHVYISATNVWTGKIAVFDRPDLTPDHVMASACLPTVFQAVEIDGVPHWDGGYLGNPPLYPLYRETETPDILLIQVNPVERRTTPRTPSEIRDRLNEITFNGNLLRELRAIDYVDGLIADGILALGANRYKQIYLHRIDGTGLLDEYGASTKLKAHWPFFLRLRDAGREAGKAWLDAHFADVGVRGTLDLRAMYE